MPVEDHPARPAPVNQGRIVHLNFATTAGITILARPCSSTLEHLLRLQEIQVQFLSEGTTSRSPEILRAQAGWTAAGKRLSGANQSRPTGFMDGPNTARPNFVAKHSERK